MKRHGSRTVTAALIGWSCLTTAALGASPEQIWPQFRGPDGNGVVSRQLPTRWGADENLAWSAPIGGGGWSSPVAAGDRIYVTTAVSKEFGGPKGFGEGVSQMRKFSQSKPPTEPMSFEVQCLNASDGSLLWKRQLASTTPQHKIHPSNTYATESPTTDGTHVFAYFAAIGVAACLDDQGNIVWQRDDLGSYRTSSDFGTGSSLAMLDGKVFVQCDNEENSYVLALDANTGSELWRDDRKDRTSWASPVIWSNRIRTELIVCGSGTVTSYDPDNGQVLWKLSGTGGSFTASPALDQDRIYFGNSGPGNRGPLIAVNAGAEGVIDLETIGANSVAWVADTSAPGMASPIVVDGLVYVLSRGILSCHRAETGERVYRERLRNASSVTSSLWAAGDALYVLNESGDTSVVRLGTDFELLASNSLPGLYWSTPSALGDAILMRDAGVLHCIRDPGTSGETR